MSPKAANQTSAQIFTLAKFAALCLAIIAYLVKMIQSNEIDETLMSICAETKGWFEMDAESGEPNETCVYARLIQLGYTSQSLASSDEKDGLSMNYFPTWPAREFSRKRPLAKCIRNV